MVALLGAKAMQLLVASQLLNGLLAPLFLVLVLLVANNRAIMGARTNGWLANALGVVATLIMTGAGLWLLIWWAR